MNIKNEIVANISRNGRRLNGGMSLSSSSSSSEISEVSSMNGMNSDRTLNRIMSEISISDGDLTSFRKRENAIVDENSTSIDSKKQVQYRGQILYMDCAVYKKCCNDRECSMQTVLI